MGLTVTFTINFAYVLYPIFGIIAFWIGLMLLFTVTLAFTNGANMPDKLRIMGRMLFRPTAFVLALHWFAQDVLRLR